MLLTRILSALVGIPVILFVAWAGGLPLTIMVLILAFLGIFEMSRLWGRMDIRVWLPGAFLSGFLFVTAAHYGSRYLLGATIFLALAAGILYLVTVYPAFKFVDLAATVFTSLYAGWLLTYLILLRQLPAGFHYLVLVLAATWGTDTLAYFVGMNLGKHKLAPVISPHKSVEGFWGGLAGGIMAAFITWLAGHRLPLVHYLLIGLLVGIIGQAGDLAESAFKRMAGVKDSSRIIPGHGGILDRFDSLFFTAPVTYYYLVLFIID